MEYIELDIKQIIHELLKGKIVQNSVELDCELPGSTLNRVYGSNVYYEDEVDGVIDVVADFTCRIMENKDNGQVDEIAVKGHFNGQFNLDQKHFLDDSCSVRL